MSQLLKFRFTSSNIMFPSRHHRQAVLQQPALQALGSKSWRAKPWNFLATNMTGKGVGQLRLHHFAAFPASSIHIHLSRATVVGGSFVEKALAYPDTSLSRCRTSGSYHLWYTGAAYLGSEPVMRQRQNVEPCCPFPSFRRLQGAQI